MATIVRNCLWVSRRVIAVVALTLGVVCAPGDPASLASDGSWRAEYKRPTAIPFPETNPYSDAKAALGRALFFDVRFSGSKTHSCGSCHHPDLAWTDGAPRARGEGATMMDLHTPTLLDMAWLDRLGWDGKFRDIEAVTFRPILAQANMNMSEALLIERLSRDGDYPALFAGAFPDQAINRRNIELAIATYERTIVSGEAPFDRWIAGDDTAIGDAAKRGFTVFRGRGRCAECHGGWSFTDGSFHDIGIAKGEDLGRGRYFPSSVKLRHAFKTPTLRDVARRAPYMHDGSLATLADVIDHYDRGGVARPSLAEVMGPLGLSSTEKADLLAFLDTLTSDKPTHAVTRAP